MNWLITALNWWLYLFLIGLIFLPTSKIIFKKFSFDFGYPFAKVVGILILSYLIFLLSSLKILLFSRSAIFLVIFLLFFFNFYWYKKNKTTLPFKNLIIEELLFLFSFLFWTYIRSQEPSIRSLEKFMDFGFINSILRTNTFPPKDMWYPPESINYYYFGHLTGAFLIKLTNFPSSVGYNLILSTIFALAISQVFSLSANIINFFLNHLSLQKKNCQFLLIFFSLITTFIVNLGGNLHTIYILTKGYPMEKPIPFWQIFSFCNTLLPSICQKLSIQLEPYWYPNATRFIPFTIHEFPSYSYVVADLHGHVFDIPFVLLTLAVLFILFISKIPNKVKKINNYSIFDIRYYLKFIISNSQYPISIFLGFLTAVHYMTNAFDGPIYLFLSLIVFFIIFRFSLNFFYSSVLTIFSFLIFSLPFSLHFKPFISGVGVNCGAQIFNFSSKIGPFLFEKDSCQSSPLWMLLLLWGFFWANFIFLLLSIKNKKNNLSQLPIFNYLIALFSFSTFLVFIPEFFYIKDIYPDHFRANTMFKLGYQAFIMMAIASGITFFLLKYYQKKLFLFINSLLFIFIFIYPFFAIPSYYGNLNRQVDLDGLNWFTATYPQDKEIIDYLNRNEKNQPFILEAQGDSYTDYGRISAMTGLPTVAGWWVHEWLWRGSADYVGKRIPDIINIYESNDLNLTKKLLKKYQVSYVIVSTLEKQKYPNLKEEKFLKLGKLVFKSSNNLGAIYKVD